MSPADDPETEPKALSAPDSRRRGREAALQMLYQWEVGRMSLPEVLATYWEVGDPPDSPATERTRAFARDLAEGTARALAEIDPLIEASAEHWRLSRMAVVDRLILRLAAYEFLHGRDTPRAAVIDEAVDLAKAFSAPDAAGFINGVLDGLKRRLEDERV